MKRVPWVLAWLVPLAAALGADGPVGRIGELTFDGTRWTARQDGPGFAVECVSKRCDAPMRLAIAPSKPGDCEPADLASVPIRRTAKMTTLQRPGLEIRAATVDIGCRNARPPSVFACMIHTGRTYRLTSVVLSCSGGPGFVDGAMDFLATLSAP